MKTKQQVVEAMFQVLSTKLDHPYLSAFHTDSRMREDLALDSSVVLQLLVTLELEHGLGLPEEALMNQDLDTVRAVAKLLYDAQPRPQPAKLLEYEEDIKLHCFVSCLSEVVKRQPGLDHRALYFGVWDSEIVVNDRYEMSYHSETISHQFFIDWFQRLYGIALTSWYQPHLGKEANIELLVSLVENRTPDQHIMVMLDMFQMKERVNEFNKDPFPHYLMLGPTKNPDEWFMYDPDYRWEGVAKKAAILEAMRHPAVSGGYVFSDRGAHAPTPKQIAAYYDVCMLLDDNLMASAIRDVLTAHLAGRDKLGNELPLSHLSVALGEIPILTIRKFAYEHGFAFYWRELELQEAEFDHWIDVIDALTKTYKLIQFQAMKLAASSDMQLADKIFGLLQEQDERERKIKTRMHEVHRQWCDVTFGPRKQPLSSEVAS